MQHVKKTCGRFLQIVGLRRKPALAQDTVVTAGRLDGFERGTSIAVGTEVRKGHAHAVVASRRVAIAEGDQPFAARHGHGPKQHGVDQRKDHGVGADAESEGHDDSG